MKTKVPSKKELPLGQNTEVLFKNVYNRREENAKFPLKKN